MSDVPLSPENTVILEKYYREEFSNLYQAAVHSLENAHLAEDAVQDCFVTATSHMEEFLSSPNPTGWLYIALKHTIQHAIRTRQQLLAKTMPYETQHDEQPAAETITVSSLDISENADLQLLYSYYIQGMPIQELAENNKISAAAMKMRISRAKKRLQNDPQIKDLKNFYF